METEKRLNQLENDVNVIKVEIKELNNKQNGSEGNIKELNTIMKEYTHKQDVYMAKQDALNDYLKEIVQQNSQILEKMDEKIEKVKDINDERYIEMIKSNSQQDAQLQKPSTIDKAADVVMDIAKETVKTNNQIKLIDRKEFWGVLVVLVGILSAITTYYFK